jgi:tetratricopeptide (TPR) repeat protein
VALLLAPAAWGQCAAKQADAAFARGMEAARAKQWAAAEKALRSGEKLCPTQKRFPIELAGAAFEQQHDAEAAGWLRRALKLDPKDSYANNFAGTVYFLMGNVPAALKYWNRVDRPQLHALNFDAQLKVRRQLLDRAIAFSPEALLRQSQYETTQVRLDALGIFPDWRMQLYPRKDGTFNADFDATERHGMASSRTAAAIATFSGLLYETVYPQYYNIRRQAVNVRSLLCWDAQTRRVWVNVSGPWHELASRRWSLDVDGRNENWAIRRSFSGTAPMLGYLNLERAVLNADVATYTSGRLQWTMGAQFSHRIFRSVQDGTALNASLVLPGYAAGFTMAVHGKPVDMPEHRFTVTAAARSVTARLWANPAKMYEKLQGDVRARWYPQAKGRRWELIQRIRAGGLLGATPFDELFELGVDQENNLWMRGHLGTRDGRRGSAPLGTSYFLSNSDVYRNIYSNGFFNIQAGPLVDIGRMVAPTTGLSTSDWMVDAGAEARITVLGTPFILTWGRDMRTGSNAFFETSE